MTSMTQHQHATPSEFSQVGKTQSLEQPPITSFDSFALPDSLAFALKDMKISCPTPIQAATIPLALEGQDVMASAQTGTGKTLAFTLPLMLRVMSSPNSNALVLAPTRELAAQVRDIVRKLLGRQPKINIALLIGGDSMGKQIAQLHARPRIIIGTPGRINDHLERGSLSLKNTDFIVVDEADRMLDMGFSVQLDHIVQFLPYQRQTLMFSATVPNNILKLAQKYLKEPVRVSVDSPMKAAPKIKQEVIQTTREEKLHDLLRELNEREGSIIVFVKTKRGADQLADKLRRKNMSADSIHGDLKQRQRDRAILHFRNNKTRIMVATDVAARGLDIPHIRHVINYDLPQEAENYIHRIGRTARAGLEGNSLSLLCPDDQAQWREINRLINPGASKEPSHQGKDRFSKGRPSKRRFGKPFQGDRPAQGRSDFSRKKKSFSDSWDRPRRDSSDESQGQSQGRSFRTDSSQHSSSEFPRKKKSFSDSWDRPRRESSDNSQGQSQSRSFRTGSSQHSSSEFPRKKKSFSDSWDRPRRDSADDSQGQSRGKFKTKESSPFQGQARRKPSMNESSQRGERPSNQSWRDGKNKTTASKPNGPNQNFRKKLSRKA